MSLKSPSLTVPSLTAAPLKATLARLLPTASAVPATSKAPDDAAAARASRNAVLADIGTRLDRLEASLAEVAGQQAATVRASRRLNRAAGSLAASVLLDGAVTHCRGLSQNPTAIPPLMVAPLVLGASLHGTADHRPAAHRARRTVYGASAVTGLLGTGFHLHSLLNRPGGLCWRNMVSGGPIGAPTAMLLAGLIGMAAEEVRNNPPTRARVLGLPAGRLLALVSGVGLVGMAGEAGLPLLRGMFQNPAAYAPVTLSPVGGALLLNAAAGPSGHDRWVTRWWLRLMALLGWANLGLHIWGVQRKPGGWRNWRQNLLDGPPVPVPPGLMGLALAGLAALGLSEEHPDS
jgi:hypothetical protein